MIKRILKPALKRTGLYARASKVFIWLEPRLTNSFRAITGKNQRLTAAYLASQDRPALHIGCGDNHLSPWLNTELCPRRDQIFLDATRPFPLPDNAFAFVYSEHMIEHIPYQDGQTMLRECFRILRPGGVVRIVTPNLAFLTTLLDANQTHANQAYVDYSVGAHKIAGPAPAGIHVFNNFMRGWGHQFIYDLPSLRRAVADAGFEQVTPCALSDSPHPELRGLATTNRMPAPFLEMESIAVEGRKPAR